MKATFSLVDGGEATVAEVQDPIFGDRPWDNDPRASLFGPDDLAPLKPKVDILLAGHAYAPGGAPVTELVTTLRVGDFAKSLRVTGDRFWVPGPSGLVASEPAPFTSMPIRYERAARSLENPVGIDLDEAAPGAMAAPNIEAEDEEGMPGFGAVAPAWHRRRDMLSAAALAWVESVTTSRDPSQGPAPHGVDFRFFNAAPADQQLDMLRVGTPITLENLHPTHSVMESRLPAVRPQVFRVDPASGRVTEVALRSDTLWIHSDRGVAVVCYRGLTDVRGGSYEAVGRLVVTADPNGKRISCERVDKALREDALHEISSGEGEDRSRLLEMRHDAVLPRTSEDPTIKRPTKPGAPAAEEKEPQAAPIPSAPKAPAAAIPKPNAPRSPAPVAAPRAAAPAKPAAPRMVAPAPVPTLGAPPPAARSSPIRAPLPLDLPIGDETIRAPADMPSGPATPFETPNRPRPAAGRPATPPEAQSPPPLVAPPPIASMAMPVAAPPPEIPAMVPIADPPPEIRLPAAALSMEIGGETLRVGPNSPIQKDVLPFQRSSGAPRELAAKAAPQAAPAAPAKTPVIRGLSPEMLGRSIGDETVRASESAPAKPVMPFVTQGVGKKEASSTAPEGGASKKSSSAAEALKSAGASLRGVQAGAPAPQKSASASPAGDKIAKMAAPSAPAGGDTKKLAAPAALAPAGEGTKGTARPAIKEDSKTLPRVIINAPLGGMALGSQKLGSPPAAALGASNTPASPKDSEKAPDPGAAEASASIEKYAAIAAEIGMKGSDRGKVLKANGLSMASWADIDEKWSDAIAQALETGDRALVDAFDAAYVATQERLGKRIGVVEYARILVGIERGEVGGVLASLELVLSDLVRIQRVWAKKLAEKPALGAEVEKAVDAIRGQQA